MHYDEEAYKKNVLSKDRRVFRASLLWLVEAEAIMLEQADRLDEIYSHRHELGRECTSDPWSLGLWHLSSVSGSRRR